MSISAVIGPFVPVPVVMLDDRRCTFRHVRVYGELARALLPQVAGVVYLRRLIERTHLHRRDVRRLLDDLEAFGYIGRLQKPGAATRYVLAELAVPQDQLPGLDNGIPTRRVHAPGTRRADAPTSSSDPARTRAKTGRAGAPPPKTLPRKTGDEESEKPEPIDPVKVFGTGLGRKFDPHAWDHVTPLGEVLDELIEPPE